MSSDVSHLMHLKLDATAHFRKHGKFLKVVENPKSPFPSLITMLVENNQIWFQVKIWIST